MRKSPRQRRLEADNRSVEKLDAESSIFSFVASGTPPTRYRLQFKGPGLSRTARGDIQIVHDHEIIVELGAAYPRLVPNLLWQTPVFHPNISNNGVVCLGGYGTHWVPSLTLDEMSTMLWDMIRYENFDIDSPYNRDAAIWARDQKDFRFPLDQRNIRDRINESKTLVNPSSNGNRLATLEPEKKRGRVLGLLGRFRNPDTAQTDGAPLPSANANPAPSSDPTSNDAPNSTSSAGLVSRDEIEVLESGIAFIDPPESSQSQTEPDEDNGIVFLD